MWQVLEAAALLSLDGKKGGWWLCQVSMFIGAHFMRSTSQQSSQRRANVGASTARELLTRDARDWIQLGHRVYTKKHEGKP